MEPALHVTKTDTLIFEYFRLPIYDLAIRFMYRIKTPVEFIWMTDGVVDVLSYLSESSLEEKMQEFALKRLHELLCTRTDGTDGEAEARKHLGWMFDITKVKVVECEMVPKKPDMLVSVFGTVP